MAIVHYSGTKLAPKPIVLPLTRLFMVSMAVLYLFAMHIFLPNSGGEGFSLPFNLTTWIAASWIIGIGLWQAWRMNTWRVSKLSVLLLVVCVLMSLPIFYPESDLSHALPRLVGLWAGWLFLSVLQQFKLNNNQKQSLLFLIILAANIEALFAYYQYFLLDADNLLGYNIDSNRPYGIFQQPNVISTFLATGLILATYCFARLPYKYNKHWFIHAVCLVTPTILLPLIIMIASRTAWLATFVSLVLMLPYLRRFVPWRRAMTWAMMCLIGIVLGAGLITDQQLDGESVAAQKLGLTSSRSFTYPQSLDMLIEKPFSGYGYGRFEESYILYTAHQHALNPDYPAGLPNLTHPQNELLYWGVEGGALPLLGILIAGCYVIYRLRRGKPGTRLATFSILVPILLHTQLEYPFYLSSIHWLSFLILLYWIDQRGGKIYDLPLWRGWKKGLQVSCWLIPTVTTLVLVTTLQSGLALTRYEAEGEDHPEQLSALLNAYLWQDRLDKARYTADLKDGLRDQDPIALERYIHWALGMIQNQPRTEYYRNLLTAYRQLDMPLKVQQVKKEADFLFPGHDFAPDNNAPKGTATTPLNRAL